MRIVNYIMFICLLLSSLTLTSAQTDPNALLQSVFNKLQKAKDYSVQANIKVDIPFVRILPVDVTIYFKQKDKFKVESKSIAIVPRQGFDQISKILADPGSLTSMIQGVETIGSIQTTIVNVIPLSDTSDLILGKLWVDPQENVILKSQLATRSSGTIITEYSYGNQLVYGLPDKMIFLVDVSKFKMPKNVTEEMDENSSDQAEDKKANKKGKIIIVLTNYQVNKGISDSVFTK